MANSRRPCEFVGGYLMAYEANLAGAGRHHTVRTPAERERAFVKAERHSRQVRILRRILPVVALLVLAAYFVSTRLNVTVGDVTASIDGMEIADGDVEPRGDEVSGQDEERNDGQDSAKNPHLAAVAFGFHKGALALGGRTHGMVPACSGEIRLICHQISANEFARPPAVRHPA